MLPGFVIFESFLNTDHDPFGPRGAHGSHEHGSTSSTCALARRWPRTQHLRPGRTVNRSPPCAKLNVVSDGHEKLRTPFHVLDEIVPGVMRLIRTSAVFPDADSVTQDFARVVATLESLAPRGLLIDLRQAVGRNDTAFEQASAPWRPRLFTVTPNTVVLVRTAAGALQVQRHLTEDGIVNPRVVRDADAAHGLVVAGAA